MRRTADFVALQIRPTYGAILFPPGRRAPLVVTGYFEHPGYSERIRPADEAVLKGVGEAAATWVG